MNKSESIGNIAKALAAAQGELRGAVKDSNNPFFKSKYADLASVWDACRAALAKNHVAVIQAPRAQGATITVTTMLAHESGEWMSEELTATAKDDSPQAVGSIVTYLRRYGLASMVGVAPEDDDGEAAQHRGPPRHEAPKHHATEDDKAAAAKVLRVRKLMDLHGPAFKGFMEKTLGRSVKNAAELTTADLDLLEKEGDTE